MMVNADARDKEVKAAQAELKAETAEIEKEKEEARQLTAKDEKLLAEWRAQRDQIRTGINDDLLRHYERVSKFRGSGISEVRDQKCMACRVMLRPQTYNEVRSGQQTIVCDSCQRILYFNPADELADQKPSTTRPKRHHPKIDASPAPPPLPVFHPRRRTARSKACDPPPQTPSSQNRRFPSLVLPLGIRGDRRSVSLPDQRPRPGQPPRLRRPHRTPHRRHPHPRRRLSPGLPRRHYRRHAPERRLDRKRTRRLRHRAPYGRPRHPAIRSRSGPPRSRYPLTLQAPRPRSPHRTSRQLTVLCGDSRLGCPGFCCGTGSEPVLSETERTRSSERSSTLPAAPVTYPIKMAVCQKLLFPRHFP